MDEKRRMQEILNHSLSGLKENPFLSQRVIAQAKGEKTVKKKISFSIVLMIAVFLIGTVTALAAGVEDINAILYKLWPEAARALRPLNMSAENAGIRLDVLSAAMSDDHLLITYSLTDPEGNRISERTECSANIVSQRMGEASGTDRMISFDAANHQAVFASYYEYSPAEYPEGVRFGDADRITFMVYEVTNPVTTVLDLWPLMKDRDYSAEAVPGPEDPSVLQMISDDIYVKKDQIPNVLNPENNLHIPVAENVELSGIGWIDGMMHVQIHVSDYMMQIETENRSSASARITSYINLRDQQGNEVMWAPGFFEELLKEMPYFIWEVGWNDGDDLWIEKIFAVQPEEMEQYVIYAEITNRAPNKEDEELIRSEWEVTFPGNMIRFPDASDQ